MKFDFYSHFSNYPSLPGAWLFSSQYHCRGPYFFFCHGSTSLEGLGHLIVEVSKSHSDTPQSVGLIWTSDRLVADLYLTKHNTQKRQMPITLAGFETAIPASEGLQTHALDRAATRIVRAVIFYPEPWESHSTVTKISKEKRLIKRKKKWLNRDKRLHCDTCTSR